MFVASALLSSLRVSESQVISRIGSVHLVNQSIGTSNTVIAKVKGTTARNEAISKSICLGPSPGGISDTQSYVLDHGRMAIFVRHMISRFNFLVVLSVAKKTLVVDEQYSESLTKKLPKKLQKNLISDNVRILGVNHDVARINFLNRDGKDGVNASFRVHNQKWTCVSAKYWRVKNWDGVRRF